MYSLYQLYTFSHRTICVKLRTTFDAQSVILAVSRFLVCTSRYVCVLVCWSRTQINQSATHMHGEHAAKHIHATDRARSL